MLRRFCAVTLWLATAPAAFAQNAPHGQSLTGLRPLTAREGLDIARSTAELESGPGRVPDCSHLVHDLYEQAGFPYSYASSLDLYNGSEKFVRVRAPQPGDLVVWRGHVGIVLHPKEHSFYSSVRSGLRTEFYDSSYWRARGRPRFYRYLTESTVTASGRAAPSIEPVGAKSASASTARGEAAAAGVSRAAATPGKALRVPMLHVSGREPVAEDVAEALAEMNSAAGELLRAGDLAQLERPAIVYRDLRVAGLEIKGKRGTAQVEIESLALLAGERMESQRRTEQLRPELQRTKKGWVMTTAKENVYVPRDVALRVLALRLASLTQDPNPSVAREREQAQIIRFLNLLVVEN